MKLLFIALIFAFSCSRIVERYDNGKIMQSDWVTKYFYVGKSISYHPNGQKNTVAHFRFDRKLNKQIKSFAKMLSVNKVNLASDSISTQWHLFWREYKGPKNIPLSFGISDSGFVFILKNRFRQFDSTGKLMLVRKFDRSGNVKVLMKYIYPAEGNVSN